VKNAVRQEAISLDLNIFLNIFREKTAENVEFSHFSTFSSTFFAKKLRKMLSRW